VAVESKGFIRARANEETMRITARTKKRLALLVVVGLLGAGGFAGLKVMRKARLAAATETALRSGTAAYEAGDYERALPHLEFYVRRHRELEAALMLAEARCQVPAENQKHILAAINYARHAAEIDPGSIRARELLLTLYLQAGYATEAGNTAEAILAVEPGHRGALDTRAMTLASLGRYDQALTIARTVVEAYPDDIQAWRQVARLMHLRDLPSAQIREYLEQAADRAASSFDFALLQVEAALLTGDAEEGLVRTRHALTFPLETAGALVQLLRVLDTLAPVRAEAQKMADAVLNREFSAEMTREIAVIAAERSWKGGRNDLAWQSISAAVDGAPALREVASGVLGWWILLRQGEAADGQLIDAKLVELRLRNDADADLWIDIVEGNRLLEDGQLKEAGSRLEMALARGRDSIVAGFLIGHVDRRRGEWRRSVARWEVLLRQHPSWRTLRAALVDVLLENGQLSAAVTRAEEAIAWTPGRPEAFQLSRAVMALFEARQADPARAIQLLTLLDQIVEQAPGDAAIQACAARAFLAAGRREPAARAVQRVLAADVAPDASLLGPLASAYRSHDAAAAQRLFEMSQQTVSPASVFAQAISLLQQERPQDARSLIEQRIDVTTGRERLAYQVVLARFLTLANDPGASAYLISLAVEHSRSPEVQIALLESDAMWKDEAPISAAIQRLREVTGAEGTAWRTHDARRLLTFTPSNARASEAIQILVPLVRQDGASPAALMMVAEAYLILDDRGTAIEFLGRAVDAEPASASYYPRLIDLLQSAGRTEEAARRLTAFARIDPLTTDQRRRRGQLALSLAVWDLALADFTELSSSGALEDRFGLARVHIRRGAPERALPILTELAAHPEATPAMVITAADLQASRGEVEAGRRLIENAPADLPPVQRQAILAAYLHRHGSSAEAEQMLVGAARAGDPDALAELARFYLEAGRLEEARRAIEPAIAAHPEHAVLRRIRALVRIQSGDESPAAWADLADTIGNWIEAPAGLRELTAAMQQRAARPEDTAGHIARIQQITLKHPSFYMGWQILFQSLAATGDLVRASDAALAAMRAIPTDPRPAQFATLLLIQRQRFEEALDTARQWREREVIDPLVADLARAWLYQQLGRPQEGLRIVEPRRQTLLAAPDVEQLTLYAGLLIDVGRVEDAASVLWPLALESRFWLRTYITLAGRIKADESTRAWLLRAGSALESTGSAGHDGSDIPARAAAQLALGEAWFRLTSRTASAGDAEQALAALLGAAEQPDLRFGAHAVMAATFDTIGNRPEAARHYRLALAERDDQPLVLNNFAYLLAQEPSTGAEAAELAARAVGLAKQQGLAAAMLGAILDTQVVALLVCQRWSEAEAAVREALQISPDSPGLLVCLAEARFGQGHAEEARTLVQTIRSRLAPSNRLAPTREARLSNLEARLP
jgi:tetratricopeptide (TPR) repeat protein